MLSASVHYEIDKILRSYLLRGKEEGRRGVKMAWAEVCLTFEEGGFAIRDAFLENCKYYEDSLVASEFEFSVGCLGGGLYS